MKRRAFIRQAATAATATALAPATYAAVLGANDRVRFGVVGINGRGKALASAVISTEDAELRALCDVDSRTYGELKQFLKDSNTNWRKVKEIGDFRKLIERKDIDAVAIATPEHWHAPMAILALQAGKHVYLEKPCSFNPGEGELLVKAQAKYGKLVQMGNQQRSARSTRAAIEAIHNGAIGEVYVGKAWYANKRGSIGRAKAAPVPDWLDWELWQGPAPRQKFEDIWVHYNWHWHRKWGTGEINNNGTHEIDLCRWALGVDFPERVQSAGGRFHFDDDWQYFDTQLASYTYADGKLISWDGRSCNPALTYDRGRGAYIGGTEGYAILDRAGSTLYNMDHRVVQEWKEEAVGATLNTVGIGPLDIHHMTNLVRGINRGEALHSPIADARISQWHCHLGNVAQDLQRVLHIDTANGHVKDDPQAMAYWEREYAPGWAPRLV